MSEIKVGDMVIIVKSTPCCKSYQNIGKIYKVLNIRRALLTCEICNKEYIENSAVLFKNNCGLAINRVIKIEPLNEQEQIIEQKKIEA